MKIKASQVLVCIYALTFLLLLMIFILPDNVLRIILGLPFVLFFPGYTLLSALFPRKNSLKDIERLALSFGLSIAVVLLIGLALNYTSWGITLNSILYSLSAFVAITSIVAWFRQWKLPNEEKFIFYLEFASWGKRNLGEKILSIILVFVILGTIGVVVYTIAVPKTGERFTEFYVLDSEGKAENYLDTIFLGQGGKVVLGIINHEHETTTYRIEIVIDGENTGEVGPVSLESEAKWEQVVTITPVKKGDKQKAEFLLYKGDSADVYESVHLFIDVIDNK